MISQHCAHCWTLLPPLLDAQKYFGRDDWLYVHTAGKQGVHSDYTLIT